MNYDDIIIRLKHYIYHDEPVPVEFAEELLSWLQARSHELRANPAHRQDEEVIRINALYQYYRLSAKFTNEEAHTIVTKMYAPFSKYLDNWLSQGRYSAERKKAKKLLDQKPTQWTAIEP